MARRAWFLALLAALLALAVVAHAQEFYPVRAVISAGEPERGRTLTLWVHVSATRSVAVIVKVAVYVPGRGWGGWRELWRGDLSAGETKLLSHTEYIPEDAEPGSVVAWVLVQFGADNFYTYKDGERYYVPYDVVQVLGALPDPQVDALKRQVEQLRVNYTALQLDYRNLRASYEALQKSYSELGARLGELEARSNRPPAGALSRQEREGQAPRRGAGVDHHGCGSRASRSRSGGSPRQPQEEAQLAPAPAAGEKDFFSVCPAR
jgi:hypothetical protein